MSDQKNSGRDAYADLLRRYEGSDGKNASGAKDSGISFASSVPSRGSASSSRPASSRPRVPSENVRRTSNGERTRSDSVRRASGARSSASGTGTSGSSSGGKKLSRKQKKFRRRLKDAASSLFLVFIVIVIVALSSLALKIPIMGCIGDIVGIDRDSTELRVVIDEGMKVDDIIKVLKDKDLIYSSAFCKFAASFFKYDKEKEYSAGTFNLSPDMGIQTMLNTIIASGEKQNTVTLTFPEGLTVDQIIAKLDENGVASADSLYSAMNTESFYETYSFLTAIKDDYGRARILEGYLAPDTYEFYLGEDPVSVITRFLNNFQNKWNDGYSEKAADLGMTVDQIVTLASILEKEGNDAEQMKMIASILYNRLNSASFPYINCDSTQFYVDSFSATVDEATLEALAYNYDTYKVTGLPKGAICNPGIAAIEAALDPAESDYYYFLHDAEGNMYVARTAEEHAANGRYLPG